MWTASFSSAISGCGRGESTSTENFNTREEAKEWLMDCFLEVIYLHVKEEVDEQESEYYTTFENVKNIDVNHHLLDRGIDNWTPGTSLDEASKLTELILNDILDIKWKLRKPKRKRKLSTRSESDEVHSDDSDSDDPDCSGYESNK